MRPLSQRMGAAPGAPSRACMVIAYRAPAVAAVQNTVVYRQHHDELVVLSEQAGHARKGTSRCTPPKAM